MFLVHRSLLTTFLRYLLYALLGALVLFTLVDAFEKIGSFLDHDATLSMMVRFYLYKAVWVIDIVLPIGMLMATLFTIGSLARYNELTALFAAGRSLLEIARPLLITALLTAAFAFAWREYVLPPANVARDRIWEVEIHKREERIRPTRNIALTGVDGRLYYARTYNPATKVVTGLKIVTTRASQVKERIDADRAEWTGRGWILHGGQQRVFSEDQEVVTLFDRRAVNDLAITPEILYQERVKPEEMNIRQLRHHNELVRRSGGDTTLGEVDIQFMLAFPAVHLIVVFMGILLASRPRKATIASGFGWTILVSFGYYICMNFGRALGHAGALPPVAAAWSGNAIYAGICWGLFARARR